MQGTKRPLLRSGRESAAAGQKADAAAARSYRDAAMRRPAGPKSLSARGVAAALPRSVLRGSGGRRARSLLCGLLFEEEAALPAGCTRSFSPGLPGDEQVARGLLVAHALRVALHFVERAEVGVSGKCCSARALRTPAGI